MFPNANLLYVDAYDSFSGNIVALLHESTGATIRVIKTDTDIQSVCHTSTRRFVENFDAIILGPGPGDPQNPADTGCFSSICDSAEILNVPILGICLGFQFLCLRADIPITKLVLPCHGQVKTIIHGHDDIFRGLGDVSATCYNSLGVQMSAIHTIPYGSPTSSTSSTRKSSCDSSRSVSDDDVPRLPQVLETRRNNVKVLARDEAGYVMAVRHVALPFWGIQFHPESCKSSASCELVIHNWFSQVLLHKDVALGRLRLHDRPDMHEPAVNEVGNDGHDPSQIVRQFDDLISDCSNAVQSCSVRVKLDRRRLGNLAHSLSDINCKAMLESAKRDRYSVYTFTDDTSWQIAHAEHRVSILRDGKVVYTQNAAFRTALQAIEEFMADKLIQDGNRSVPFWGGFVGHISYEPGLDLLDVTTRSDSSNSREVPDMTLLWVDRSIVVDHHTDTIHIQSLRKNDKSWIRDIEQKLQVLSQTNPQAEKISTLREILSRTTITLPNHDKYIAHIKSCQSELHAGNSYELCLTTSAEVTTPNYPDTSWLLYNNLQQFNPAPFSTYLKLAKVTILSSSPEQFMSWSREGTIDMMPMKGTVKKTAGMTHAKASAILSTPKESAENLMIADLIRHDLHKSLGPGSVVEVVKFGEVIEHETVFQLVSHIRAYHPADDIHQESPSHDSLTSNAPKQKSIRNGHRALRTAFPPGSMTGAPKKRSCEILRKLEDRDRGVYSGVLGYFDIGGGGCWNVCIRTAFSNSASFSSSPSSPAASASVLTSDDTEIPLTQWRVGAGGAITVLSDPEAEWDEMMTKLNSVLTAFRVCPE